MRFYQVNPDFDFKMADSVINIFETSLSLSEDDEAVFLVAGGDDAYVVGLVSLKKIPDMYHMDYIKCKQLPPIPEEAYQEYRIHRHFVFKGLSIGFFSYGCTVTTATKLVNNILHKGIYCVFEYFGKDSVSQDYLALMAINIDCKFICLAELLLVSVLESIDFHGVSITLGRVGVMAAAQSVPIVYYVPIDDRRDSRLEEITEAVKHAKFVLCGNPKMPQVFRAHPVINGTQFKHIATYVLPSPTPILEFVEIR